jgi:hypothetical protein
LIRPLRTAYSVRLGDIAQMQPLHDAGTVHVHCLGAQAQLEGNFLGCLALGDEPQDLDLPFGQLVACGWLGWLQQALRNRGAEIGARGHDTADRLLQFVRRCIFHEVAASTAGHGAFHEVDRVVHGQHQQLDLRA